MRILVVSNLYPPGALGGYEISCAHVVDGLMARGHEVHVLTTSLAQSLGNDQVHISRSMSLRAFSVEELGGTSAHRSIEFDSSISQRVNTFALLDMVQKFTPDVVYLFNLVGLGGLALLDALNLMAMPWVWHLGDRVPIQLLRGAKTEVAAIYGMERFRGMMTGTMVSISRNLIEEIDADLGSRFADSAAIVPGWAWSTETMEHDEYQRGGVTRFVVASSFGTEKGIELVIGAAQRLVEEGTTEFSIDMYGFGDPTGHIRQASQAGVLSHITFRSAVSQTELREIFRHSDALLFPTAERESFGLSPVEAAREGCVPIVTATAGVSEQLVDGVHCLKIDRNVESVYGAMRSIIFGKVDLKGLGRRAQMIASQSLSVDHGVQAIEKILQAALDSSARKDITESRVGTIQEFKELVAIHAINRSTEAEADGER